MGRSSTLRLVARVERLLVASVVTSTCLLAAAGAFLLARLHSRGGAPVNAGLGDVLGSLGFVFAGAFLARRRPRNPVGWLLLAVGVVEELSNVTGDYGTLGHRLPRPLLLTDWVLWAGSWLWLPGFAALVTLLLQLYPDGLLPGPRARWLARASLLSTICCTMAFALAPDSVRDPDTPTATNPVGWEAGAKVLLIVGGTVLALCIVASFVATGRRFWRAQAPLRQQLAWLLTATIITTLGKGLVPIDWLSSASLALIPVAVAVGVLRYRLLGIETVVRRTLLYTSLTAVVALVFTLVTAGLAAVLPDGPLPNLLAAGVIVVGITPARDLLQRAVDRLVRGPRVDPLQAVAGVGAAAVSGDDAGLVSRVLESVAIALRSEYTAVLGTDNEVIASYGHPGPSSTQVRLRYADRDLGHLVITGDRNPDLVAALAPQVAVVVRAVALNADLDATRQQAIGAALAERGRLRRDLHDGLGPSLSGVALGLEAATMQMNADPDAALDVLGRIRVEVTSAVAEVHRLLDGLRPPELVTYGLAAALRERLALPGIGPRVNVHAPAALPPLDPTVELSAYRIVCEAVTNARKHAAATYCDVTLDVVDATLRIRVTDNGRGVMAEVTGGVGLLSMRHRAEEHGGWLTLTRPDGGGTLLEAELRVDGP
jgi:signal transduction histidine kinase